MEIEVGTAVVDPLCPLSEEVIMGGGGDRFDLLGTEPRDSLGAIEPLGGLTTHSFPPLRPQEEKLLQEHGPGPGSPGDSHSFPAHSAP